MSSLREWLLRTALTLIATLTFFGLIEGGLRIAGALARLNRPTEAIAELESAIAIQPDFAPAHCDLGLLLAGRNQFERAIQRYAESLRLNPHNADALNNWGAVLARQNRPAEARSKFKAALALDPRHAAARRNLELLERP